MNTDLAGSSPRTPWCVHIACYVILGCALVGVIAASILLPLSMDESSAAGTSPLAADEADGVAGDPVVAVRQRIDPNTATLHDWTRLPGIGEVMARKIIAYRDAQQPFAASRPGDEAPVVFRAPCDLEAVSGLSAAAIERIASHLAFPAGSDR
ncbi:MAG TPA: helix-hairpin-helix domain-containing protein [Phycisphaerae bacterium]|nr:helix-hairpin-helix domain-containing protein [Phycisphaerae bacterium]HRY68132.1 helix-hairpin-helix domain-containing protein [Phycisphaerae bacterium]HSA28785.1 helix-hairpin-helix domain-containing protein [Phycisphaerae bacterium]